jgi:hypothetical protein
MNRTRPFAPIRRLAGILAALATALLAAAMTAPAAFAKPIPPGGGGTVPPPSVPTVVVGGMPGWQIALIAVAAAVVAAAAALILDRARPPAGTSPLPAPNPRQHRSARPRKATRATRPGTVIGHPRPESAPCTPPWPRSDPNGRC